MKSLYERNVFHNWSVVKVKLPSQTEGNMKGKYKWRQNMYIHQTILKKKKFNEELPFPPHLHGTIKDKF